MDARKAEKGKSDMSDPNEDRAYELGFVPDNGEIYSEKEFSQMLRDRTKRVEAYRRTREEERKSQAAVNRASTRRQSATEEYHRRMREGLENTYRKPITEDWLMEQEDARRAAVRDLTIASKLDLFVIAALLVGLVALLAGVAYSAQWLFKVLFG